MPTINYTNADGKRVKSVTTVLGRFKEAGGLLYWHFEQGFEQGQKAAKGEPFKNIDQIKEAQVDPGTLAHAMVEAHVLGRRDKWPKKSEHDAEDWEQAKRAYDAFSEWWGGINAEVEITEKSIVSELMQVGATPDAIGWVTVNGKRYRALFDWKAARGIYRDYGMQVAAYRAIWEEVHPDDPIERVYIGRFGKDMGEFEYRYLPEPLLKIAFELFERLNECYELDKQFKKVMR